MSLEVAQALLEIGAVGFRPDAPVTFKSGILSPVYCDNRRFPFHPAAWARIIAAFETLIADAAIPFDVLAGIEAAGIPHSAALGFAMQRPSVFVRKAAKEHGTRKLVEGGDVRGQRVLLVEDLVTTGLSSLAGVEALRAEGAIAEHCLAIISYGFPEASEKFRTAGMRLHTLTTFDEVLQLAHSSGALSDDELLTVRVWLEDPHGWSVGRRAL